MYPEMNMARDHDLLLSCMDELVERVNETRRICKALLNRGLLNEDKYRTIVAFPRPQDRMKQILNALSSKGQQGREALYRLLQEHEPELTLQMEHAVYVHTVRHRLIQSVKQVEPVGNRMLNHGLITEEEYFQVCEEEGSEARMNAMFRVLEQHGMKQSDGFYNALFYCEPLLYRELEKNRVLQSCKLDNGSNQSMHLVYEDKLEERLREVERKEKQVENEKQELRRKWDLLEQRQAEMDEERKRVFEMKQELEQLQRKWDETKENMNSSFLTEREEQRITGQREQMNINGFTMPVNANN
ncbi:trichohyalin-like [Tachysurus fulvidraco]|uniref:trichohyalin-like n=1 Tax=Tachysurus fulvidraco TaxID=1234273 RepID=UPI001FEFA01D|nr:trichohyalin-like [Tachysurus fulvidraco]